MTTAEYLSGGRSGAVATTTSYRPLAADGVVAARAAVPLVGDAIEHADIERWRAAPRLVVRARAVGDKKKLRVVSAGRGDPAHRHEGGGEEHRGHLYVSMTDGGRRMRVT